MKLFSLFSLLFLSFSSSVSGLTFPTDTPPGEIAGGTLSEYFQNAVDHPCPTNSYITGFSGGSTTYMIPECGYVNPTVEIDDIEGGIEGYVSRFGTGGDGLMSSSIFQSGSFIGIGTTNPTATLSIGGNTTITNGYLDYHPGGVACSDGQILSYSFWSSRWQCATLSQGVSGTGTNNSMAKWSLSGSQLILSGSTEVYESGGYIGIGTATPSSQLHIDSGVAGVSGVRFTQLTASTIATFQANAAVGVDGSGNLVAIPPGNVAVYTGVNRTSPPTPNPNTATQEIGYDFNRFFAIPGKATFVVTNGSSSSYNGPYFKENGSSAVCSWNGTYGSSAYDCAVADPETGLSASPHNSFTMTAKGDSYGYQLALGARGDAPLFARSGRYNGYQTGGLYTNDSPYQTPAPWQKVITVPANHPEYFYINTGLNSQIQAITGGGNVGIGTSFPEYRFVVAYSGSTGATSKVMKIWRGRQGSDTSMITTFGTPYLSVGGEEYRTNSIQTIGFGYDNSSYQPAEIGFRTTSTSGNTQGEIVFANRNGTSNTVPTEVMRITPAGDVSIGNISPTAKLDVNGTAKIGTAGTPLNAIIRASVTSNVSSVAANSNRNVTMTVNGADTTGSVIVSPSQALGNGLVIAWARVSSDDTVEIGFRNTTGSAIDPPSMTYYITVIQ